MQNFKKNNVPLVDCKEEWTRTTFNEFPADIKTVLDEEKKTLVKANSTLQQQICAFEKEKHFVDTFATGQSEDIVQFDVSGERMAVKRSTLGLCRDSVLAKQFENKINGTELLLFGRDDLKEIGITRPGTLATVIGAIDELKNSHLGNVILVEQSTYCFGKMIDQLRLRAMCEVDDELAPEPSIREPDKKRFKRVVDYYFPGDESSSFILGRSRR